MNWLHTILILIGAFLAVFWQSDFQGFRRLLSAQIDLRLDGALLMAPK